MVSISVKVTVPKNLFKDKDFVGEITSMMKKTAAPALKELFRKTTFGWSKKPSFRQTLTRHASYLSMEVYTEDEIYGLVNAGSPHHDIFAKPGGLLSFKKGYIASTKPGQLISRRKYRSNPVWTAKFITPHPGFKPREFDKLVAHIYEYAFRFDVQAAVTRASRRNITK